MNIIEHSVKRPVAVGMICLVVLATGLSSLFRLPLEISPNVEFPRLTITSTWPGTSPEIMEAFVTSPLEGAANTVSNVKEIESVTEEGVSRVEIKFVRDVDMNFAAMELNEKLSQIRLDLPLGASQPQISKYVPRDFRQDKSFFSIRISGPYSVQILRKFGLKKIKPVFLGIAGIAEVSVIGGKDRALKIVLDKGALRNFGLKASQVQMAINSLGKRLSVGAVSEGKCRMILFVDNPVDDVIEIENITLKNFKGTEIKLKDVGKVKDAFADPENLSRINGQPAVVVNIAKEVGHNSIKVADTIIEKLESLTKVLPAGLTLTILTDRSQDIRTNLKGLGQRAFFSVLVIFLVLLMFLHSFKAPLIILSTIFFSVLFTFNLFILAKMTLNLLTLAGLALGFGMLVDNAIVVVENISRHNKAGAPIKIAAVKASSEVVMPIIAATMTTLAAFIPFLYLTGELRLYYLPFTLAVGMSLISSLIVAFTLTPTLTARMHTQSKVRQISDQEFKPLAWFKNFLKMVLHHRGLTFFITLIIMAVSIWIFVKYVPQGKIYRYKARSGETLRAFFSLPRGSRLQLADKLMKRFEEKALGKPYVEKVVTSVGKQRSSMVVSFPKEILNTAYPYMLREQLASVCTNMAGINLGVSGFGDPIYISGNSMSSNYGSNRLQILGYNYNKVKQIAIHIAERLKRNVRVKSVNIDASSYWGSGDMSEVVLRLKREQLGRYNLSPGQLLSMIQKHLRSRLGRNSIKIGLESLDYGLKFESQEEFTIDDLKNLLIPLATGESLRMSDVSYIDKQKTMGRIERKNQQYLRVLSFDFRGPWKLAQKLEKNILETTHLPPGYKIQKREYTWMTETEKSQIYYVMAISLFLVFLVTAGLFESFLHPLLILITVPLSLAGVFLIFYFTGTNFDRSAYIGVVLLAGIVVNDSILLVDHINLERKNGLGIIDAVIAGAADRMRPILMTTFTTIGGLLPLVLLNEGQNMWYSLALATIGGLIASTTLVLTVIPALYVTFEKSLEVARRRKNLI